MIEPRTPPAARRPSSPDLDAEQEVDFGRWARALATRWWLPFGGLAAGLVVGYLLSLGGAQVYKAEALVSLGSPFTPNGGGQITSLATNPRLTAEIIHSESALRLAASAAGMRVGELRGKVSTRDVSGVVGVRATGSPLVGIGVKGSKARKAELAANRLAQILLSRVSPYVRTKIRTLGVQLRSEQDQLESLAPRIALLDESIKKSAGLAPLDRLVLVSQLDNAEGRRGQLVDVLTATQQQLALAKNVESPQIVQKAAAVASTARSRRNSVLVGGIIGLILGAVAALVWDSVGSRMNRRPAV